MQNFASALFFRKGQLSEKELEMLCNARAEWNEFDRAFPLAEEFVKTIRIKTAVFKQSRTVSRSSELSPLEKAQAWREWADSHGSKSPFLSNEAISRESIYGDRG